MGSIKLDLNNLQDNDINTLLEETEGDLASNIQDYLDAAINIPLINTNLQGEAKEKAIKSYKDKATSSGIPFKYRFACPFTYVGKDGKNKTAEGSDFGTSFAQKAEYDKCDNGSVEGSAKFKKNKRTNYDLFSGTKLPTTPKVLIRFEDTETRIHSVYFYAEGEIEISIFCNKNIEDTITIPIYFKTMQDYETRNMGNTGVVGLKVGQITAKYIFGIPGEVECERTPQGLWRTVQGEDLVDLFDNGTYQAFSSSVIEYSPGNTEYMLIDGVEEKIISFNLAPFINLLKATVMSTVQTFGDGLNVERWENAGGNRDKYEKNSCGSIEVSKIIIYNTSEFIIGNNKPDRGDFQQAPKINSVQDL